MRADKAQISGKQFMFSVACLLQSSVLLTSLISSIAAGESWLVTLLGMVAFLPVIWMYRTLMILYPDKNLVEMLESAFGAVPGRILGSLYAWFFLTLTSLNAYDLGNFMNFATLSETPRIILILICLIVSASAVGHGIKVVARYGAAFVMLESGIMILSVILVSNLMDFSNYLPVFRLPLIKYVQGAHVIMTIPFGELIIFLMIRPNVTMSGREVTKYLFIGAGIGAATLLIELLRDIAVEGPLIEMFTLPGLTALRLVRLGEALSHMEILFIIALIVLLLFKITLLYYVFMITVAQILNLKTLQHLVSAAGLLIAAYGSTLYPTDIIHVLSAREDAPFTWAVFEVVIPFILLAATLLRRAVKTKEAALRQNGG